MFSYCKLMTVLVISCYGEGTIGTASSAFPIISPWNLQIARGGILLRKMIESDNYSSAFTGISSKQGLLPCWPDVAWQPTGLRLHCEALLSVLCREAL